MNAAEIDWERFGRENGHLGRYELRAALEAAGLPLNSREYHLALEAIRRGGNSAEQARAAERAEAALARLAPFLAEVRADAAAWGSVEDGSLAGGDLEAAILEEARQRAYDAEERAAEEARAAEREAEELLDYRQRQDSIDACERAAEAAVIAAGWSWTRRKCGHDCSRYFWIGRLDADGEEDAVFGLRISDHYAKNGSGWNEAKQEQHDAPDINIVIRRGAAGEYTFDLTALMETLDQ